MKKYEVIHQHPNGESESVFKNTPEEALDLANEILKGVTPQGVIGFVSVSEVEIRNDEIYESAILLARAYMHA